MFNEHSNIVINIHGHEFEISGRKAVGAFVIAVLVTVFCLGLLIGHQIPSL